MSGGRTTMTADEEARWRTELDAPYEPTRSCKASAMRRDGMSYKDIATQTGLHSGQSARSCIYHHSFVNCPVCKAGQ